MLYDYFSMTPFLRLSKITDMVRVKSSALVEHQVCNYIPRQKFIKKCYKGNSEIILFSMIPFRYSGFSQPFKEHFLYR